MLLYFVMGVKESDFEWSDASGPGASCQLVTPSCEVFGAGGCESEVCGVSGEEPHEVYEGGPSCSVSWSDAPDTVGLQTCSKLLLHSTLLPLSLKLSL